MKTEENLTKSTQLVTKPTKDEYKLGKLLIQTRERNAYYNGKLVEVSPQEYRLLELFVMNPDHVLDRTTILEYLWGRQIQVQTRVVDVYVGYLRKKFSKLDFQSIRGRGYRLLAR